MGGSGYRGGLQNWAVTIFLQMRGVLAFSGNGRRLDDLSLMVVQPNDEFCMAADGALRRWCSLYIPNGDLVSGNGPMAESTGEPFLYRSYSRTAGECIRPQQSAT